MADVLLLVGKGNAAELITESSRRVQEGLARLGLSVVAEQQSFAMAEVSAKVPALVGQHQPRVLVTVGFTLGVKLAEGQHPGVPWVAVLPDVPSSASGLYDSTVDQLAGLLEATAYLVVLDEASRALAEHQFSGASGSVLVADKLKPVSTLCQPLPQVKPTKILVSSHDFRFIGDAVAHLSRIPNVEVRLQEWKLSDAAPTDEQRADAEWADVVLAEWAGRNAVWFSQNLSETQRLVVHLHGFEAQAEWIDQLDLNRVDELVVVSEFYKQQLVATKGWQSQKLRVIPNALETAVFDRCKREDAKFHLAMLGFVPFLKRADMALEVLRSLLAKDDRYILHLRGDAPWQHDWVWNRRVREADAFAELYASIGQDAVLRDRVVFERYGSNVEAWLSGIGWLLSLSDRETFHLAAAEGMASGAVPVFLPRNGVTEIFSDRWVFESPQAIADFIDKTIKDDMWQRESMAAQEFVTRFDVAVVRSLWQEVLV